jgi:hypothetical protein
MSLESRIFYPERFRLSLPSPKDTPRLPPLATIVMTSLAAPSFGRQASGPFLATRSGLLQHSSEIGSQIQQCFTQIPNEAYSVHTSEPWKESPLGDLLTAPPAPPVKPIVNGFQFIQINKPSGKTDSTGGANMRSHIMRRFHENRRRQSKGRVPLSLAPTPHRCSTTRSLATFVHGFENVVYRHNLPPNAASPETIRLQAVCSQCGVLLLQQTSDDGWSLHGRSFGAPQGVLGSGSTDPFDSAAIPISHKMHGLIHHCKFNHQIHFSRPLTAPLQISTL